MKNFLTILFLITASFLTSCQEPDPSKAPEPNPDSHSALNDEAGIRTAKPGEVGIDSTLLDSMTAAIVRNEYPNIHSVLIVKDGKLVYESYFPGVDEIRGNPLGRVKHSRDSLHDLRSVSKSVTSACIGLAIEQGKIKSEDQSLWDFFPEYKSLINKENSVLTLKHLLTMTPGFEWNEAIPYTDPANSEIQMDESEDPIRFVLSRKIVAAPGKTFNYCGGATEVLAVILRKATGMNVEEFVKTFLFKPLHINQYYWIKFDSTIASKNQPAAASGLRLRSRDMVKFGMLYMNDGIVDGKQLLSKNWVKKSHQSHVLRGDSTQGYGYQFWTSENKYKGGPVHIATAAGNGDQRIYFDRTNNLLVVVTAGNYNNWSIKNNSWQLVENFIYPALR